MPAERGTDTLKAKETLEIGQALPLTQVGLDIPLGTNVALVPQTNKCYSCFLF